MSIITIDYEGDLHCRAMHAESRSTLLTDAPKDNLGRGESFSPTDLVAAALGSCILTMMGIAARALDIDIMGTTATVDKEMARVPVRRIQRLAVRVHVPHRVSVDHKQRLIAAALACPVHKSMHPDVQLPVEITWGDDDGA